MAENIIRRSPVAFDSTPAQTEMRDSWNVVLEYENQGDGPWVIDLCHRARWDLQDPKIDAIQPWGLKIPDTPGRCVSGNGVLINRMNRTQSSIWHLSGDKPDSTLILCLIRTQEANSKPCFSSGQLRTKFRY